MLSRQGGQFAGVEQDGGYTATVPDANQLFPFVHTQMFAENNFSTSNPNQTGRFVSVEQEGLHLNSRAVDNSFPPSSLSFRPAQEFKRIENCLQNHHGEGYLLGEVQNDLGSKAMPQTSFRRKTVNLCTTCGKEFTRKSDLLRHHKIHNNDRKFSCPYPPCEKRFIQKSALKVHIRTHTRERPHVCPTCQKDFADSSSLSRHRRIHEKFKIILKCPVHNCIKSFSRTTSIKRHFVKAHPDVPANTLMQAVTRNVHSNSRSLSLESSFETRNASNLEWSGNQTALPVPPSDRRAERHATFYGIEHFGNEEPYAGGQPDSQPGEPSSSQMSFNGAEIGKADSCSDEGDTDTDDPSRIQPGVIVIKKEPNDFLAIHGLPEPPAYTVMYEGADEEEAVSENSTGQPDSMCTANQPIHEARSYQQFSHNPSPIHNAQDRYPGYFQYSNGRSHSDFIPAQTSSEFSSAQYEDDPRYHYLPSATLVPAEIHSRMNAYCEEAPSFIHPIIYHQTQYGELSQSKSDTGHFEHPRHFEQPGHLEQLVHLGQISEAVPSQFNRNQQYYDQTHPVIDHSSRPFIHGLQLQPALPHRPDQPPYPMRLVESTHHQLSQQLSHPQVQQQGNFAKENQPLCSSIPTEYISSQRYQQQSFPGSAYNLRPSGKENHSDLKRIPVGVSPPCNQSQHQWSSSSIDESSACNQQQWNIIPMNEVAAFNQPQHKWNNILMNTAGQSEMYQQNLETCETYNTTAPEFNQEETSQTAAMRPYLNSYFPPSTYPLI